LPVVVFDRETSTTYTVWLERVQRKLVSVSGAVLWAYSLLTKDDSNGEIDN